MVRTNPESRREYQREWYRQWAAANPDKVRAKNERNRERTRQRRREDPEAVRERERRYREANPERRREWDRQSRARNADAIRKRQRARYSREGPAIALRKHGMTPADYTALWDRQGGRCYLCGDELAGRGSGKAAIDHDHACCPPGRSCDYCRRGITCGRCNQLIGFAQDDPARLRLIADNFEPVLHATRERVTFKPPATFPASRGGVANWPGSVVPHSNGSAGCTWRTGPRSTSTRSSRATANSSAGSSAGPSPGRSSSRFAG